MADSAEVKLAAKPEFLEIVGPFLSTVNYGQNVNESPPHTVWQEPGCARDHKFSSTWNPARAAGHGMPRQNGRRLLYPL